LIGQPDLEGDQTVDIIGDEADRGKFHNEAPEVSGLALSIRRVKTRQRDRPIRFRFNALQGLPDSLAEELPIADAPLPLP